MAEQLYAVYPGVVTLYDGTQKTWTALALATAYGVQNDNYLVVNNAMEVPDAMNYFNYIHLKPRQDDLYQDIKYVSEDDDQDVAYRPDFDATKRWIDETDPRHIDSEVDFSTHKRDN